MQKWQIVQARGARAGYRPPLPLPGHEYPANGHQGTEENRGLYVRRGDWISSVERRIGTVRGHHNCGRLGGVFWTARRSQHRGAPRRWRRKRPPGRLGDGLGTFFCGRGTSPNTAKGEAASVLPGPVAQSWWSARAPPMPLSGVRYVPHVGTLTVAASWLCRRAPADQDRRKTAVLGCGDLALLGKLETGDQCAGPAGPPPQRALVRPPPWPRPPCGYAPQASCIDASFPNAVIGVPRHRSVAADDVPGHSIVASVGKTPNHMSKTRSSRRASGAAGCHIRCTHRNTGRHPSAWFRFSPRHMPGR